MEIENPKMHCFGQRHWKLHQCTSKIRSSKNVVQNAFFSHFFFGHIFKMHFFRFVSQFCKTMWNNVKNVKKCILKIHREKMWQNVFWKCIWKTCEKCILKMWKNVKQMHLDILRGKMPGQFLSLDFCWATGSLLFGGPVPQKVWGRLPGWRVWWWSHGHMDWFENRVPSKWLLDVAKWFPNSSSSVLFCFGSQPIWFVGCVYSLFYIIYLDLSISIYQHRQYLHVDFRWCMAVNQKN